MTHALSGTSRTSRVDILLLFVLSSVYLLWGLGRGSLASWDEAIYAAVAKEMLASGDWFRLTLGGQAWCDKPPLAIWFTALSFQCFGVNEFAARLFSALCGVGTVLVTYLAARRLFGDWTGLLSAAVLLSSSHFLNMTRFGMTDGPLTFFVALTLYLFWLGRERNRYLIFSGVALGLGIMTKGYAALLAPAVVLLYGAWARDGEALGRSSYWVGILLAVLIALPWHLFEMVTRSQLYFDGVVVRHLFQRTTQAIEGHSGNAYFYIRTMINKYHPWAILSVFTAPWLLWEALRRRRGEVVFTASWLFGVFAVITAVQTKLAWYILPLYPALSISVGLVLARWIPERRRPVVCLILVLAMPLHVKYSHLWEQDYSAPIKRAVPAVLRHVPPGAVVHLYRYHESPAAHFYYGRPNAYLEEPGEVERESARPGFYCLVRQEDWAQIEPLVLSGGLRVLADAGPLKLIGRAEPPA